MPLSASKRPWLKRSCKLRRQRRSSLRPLRLMPRKRLTSLSLRKFKTKLSLPRLSQSQQQSKQLSRLPKSKLSSVRRQIRSRLLLGKRQIRSRLSSGRKQIRSRKPSRVLKLQQLSVVLAPQRTLLRLRFRQLRLPLLVA